MQQHRRMDDSYNQSKRNALPTVIYLVLFLVGVALVFGVWSFVKVKKIERIAIPPTADMDKFLKRVTAHSEAQEYAGVVPLNVVQITQSNLGNFQAQIAGLDTSYIGSYMVQYANSIIVYDYAKNSIRGRIDVPQASPSLPQDFSAKLYAHPEAAAFQGEQPQGGQLDASTLATLKQQFPDFYANAKEGDYLLRYSTKLVIYDYANDRIVNAINLQ